MHNWLEYYEGYDTGRHLGLPVVLPCAYCSHGIVFWSSIAMCLHCQRFNMIIDSRAEYTQVKLLD
jgi:hypothetical protein